MDDRPNYYAVIPANVRYDNDLRANEKLLYGEITALACKTGSCWASNEYFSILYDVKPNAVATWIRHLKEKNYILVDYEYEEGTKEISKRVISIGDIQKDNTSYSKEYRGGIQKGEDNNTSINNTSKKEIYKERFKKPTLEEIEKYCKERNKGVDPKKFFDYYEVSNWTDSKGNKVKNWKQKVITWERHFTQKDIDTPNWFNKEIKEERDEEYENFLKGIEGYDK